MAHGRFPREYISNPHIHKPIEEIYSDINSFTWELFEGDPEVDEKVDLTVVLPPLIYEGHFVKGLVFSRGVDFLKEFIPDLQSFFQCMAYTMFCSYPWSRRADAYLACYRNPSREGWYRNQCTAREKTAFIPLADTDYLDEYRFAPVRGVAKDIDVLCVSRLQDVKNVRIIARALAIYRRKYPGTIRLTLITGHRKGISLDTLPPYAVEQYLAIEKILGDVDTYIDLIGYVNHFTELPKFYSRSKVFVLGSLIEGKNRSIAEAMSCNVPVVCFSEFNQFARQGHPIMSAEAGICCTFDPEHLADAIHLVLQNSEIFSPRLSYLRGSGRRNFLNQCIDFIPYYREALPGFVPGQHVQNHWIDAALQHTYGMDLLSFIYRPGPGLARAWGKSDTKRLVDHYKWLMTDGG
jgi:glycosyltransferase involved in cell wall biosynthesis